MGVNVWVKDIRADLTLKALKLVKINRCVLRDESESRIPERLTIRLKGMADQAEGRGFLSPIVMFTHSVTPEALIQELAPGTN